MKVPVKVLLNVLDVPIVNFLYEVLAVIKHVFGAVGLMIRFVGYAGVCGLKFV